MTTGTDLEMQALDVTAAPWEDLRREVLADDPDAVAPRFIGDSSREGIFLCYGSASCIACCSSGFCVDPYPCLEEANR